MRILTSVLTTFLLIAIIALATLVLATRIPATGLSLKIVKSGSMEPTIHTGSVVLIAPAKEYLEGDIITFGQETKDTVPTTHRVVSERIDESGQRFFTTKGDANEDKDPVESPASSVQGHVVVAIPYAGYLLAFARTPLGFTLLILIPAGLIVLGEVVGIARALRRPKQKQRKREEFVSEPVAPRSRAEPRIERAPAPSFAPPRSMGRF